MRQQLEDGGAVEAVNGNGAEAEEPEATATDAQTVPASVEVQS